MNKNIISTSKSKYTFSVEQIMVAALLLVGVVLRLRQYLLGRSLWLDEAMLALNIVNRDFAGLFQPLDYDQGAPIGFLLIEKVANVLFGDHELVLRLFPFLASVATIFIFYFLLEQLSFSKQGKYFALLMFVFSPNLIGYSAQAKQYSVDVFCVTVLLFLAAQVFGEDASVKNYLLLGILGVFLFWFSHPALFVLASIGIALFIQIVSTRDRSKTAWVVGIGILWLSNLLFLYITTLKSLRQNHNLVSYWQEAFMPVPPWRDWLWFNTYFAGSFKYILTVNLPVGIIIVMSAIGVFYLFKNKKSFAIIIFGTYIFSLIASGFGIYPFMGRMILFTVPLILILLGACIDFLVIRLKNQTLIAWTVFVLIIGCFLYQPIREVNEQFISPKYNEHIRPAMAELAKSWDEGDVLFVSYGANPAFRFYAERYGLGGIAYQTSDYSDYNDPGKLLSYVDALNGNPRVWILMTHVYEQNAFNEKDYLLAYLDSIGEMKREFRKSRTGVHLFLYDLSQ